MATKKTEHERWPAPPIPAPAKTLLGVEAKPAVGYSSTVLLTAAPASAPGMPPTAASLACP